MFLNKIRNLFCVPVTKFVSAANVARAGKRENICVGHNVSSFARAFNTTPEKFENAVLFLLSSTLIRRENGAFLKTLAFRFRVWTENIFES